MKNRQLSITAAGFLLSAALAGSVAAADYGDYNNAAPAAPATPLTFKGGMLVDANGMTLYTFDKDVSDSRKSVCNGPCAANWHPALATAQDQKQGQFTIITRDDGQRQWAFNGKPVYTWLADKRPGDKTGDNFNKVWHIVPQ